MTVADASLDGLQQIVDRLAAQLQRSVAIDDAQGRLVVSSGHFGEEDAMRVFAIVHRYSDPRVMAHFKTHGIYTWTEPGRIPENQELQFKGRVCCPIRDHDILFGHLFLIDEGVTDEEIAKAADACVQIGQLMYRRLALHTEAQRQAEILVRSLISPDPRSQSKAIHAAIDDKVLLATDPGVAVVVRVVESSANAESRQTDLQSAVELTTRDRFREVSLAWVRPDEVIVLLFGRAASAGRQAAEQLVSRLVSHDHQVVAGVGSVRTGTDAAATSFADAALCARAANLLPELGTVVPVEALGVYRLLLKLPPDELDTSRYPIGLQRLLDIDASDSLVDTLETYLDCGGDVARTSATLHVHRSTLYYRLSRIEKLARVDLSQGEQRLVLHLGLKLRRLISG